MEFYADTSDPFNTYCSPKGINHMFALSCYSSGKRCRHNHYQRKRDRDGMGVVGFHNPTKEHYDIMNGL